MLLPAGVAETEHDDARDLHGLLRFPARAAQPRYLVRWAVARAELNRLINAAEMSPSVVTA